MRASSPWSSGSGGGEGVEQGGGSRRPHPAPPAPPAAPPPPLRRLSVPTVGEQGGVGSFGLRRVAVVRRGSVCFSSA
jgi:hypothetical protein